MVIDLMLLFVRLCLGVMTFVARLLAVLLVLAVKLFQALRRASPHYFAWASAAGYQASPFRRRRFKAPRRRLRRPFRWPRRGRA